MQSEPPALGLVERAMTNAMHGVTCTSQLAGEMAADEPPGTCYPNRHHAALWAMNE
jgi:hypothetical protein